MRVTYKTGKDFDKMMLTAGQDILRTSFSQSRIVIDFKHRIIIACMLINCAPIPRIPLLQIRAAIGETDRSSYSLNLSNMGEGIPNLVCRCNK